MGELLYRAAFWAAAAAEAAEGQPVPAGEQAGIGSMLIPIVIFVFIFYFMILRPQKKREKEHAQMISSISRGDTVITAGGFFGKVSGVLDDSYIIEMAEGVRVRILKSSISTKREAGSPEAPAADAGERADDRPRRRRRRRRPEGAREGDAEAMTDGVTPEESRALIDDAPDESKPENSGDAANAPEQDNGGNIK